MVNLAEVRADATYFVARNVIERLVPPIPLTVNYHVTLEQAKGAEKFEDRAGLFYSVSRLTVDGEEKVEALLNLAQELINLGRFRQARQFLNSEQLNIDFLIPDPNRALYYEAVEEEKHGWIADYEGGYSVSLARFRKARGLLERIPRPEWRKEEEGCHSTTTHFLGRGHYGLASQGIDRTKNTRSAIVYFEQDLERARELRRRGQADPANEAFQHAWLARCYLLLDDLDRAGIEIGETGMLFEESVLEHPKSGVTAHYHLLRGRLRLYQGLPDLAIEEFNEALRIRKEVEHYPKGYADAAVGLAMAYWNKDDLANSAKYAFRAVRAYPLILAKGAFGG